jgi:hypothetical protein
MPGMKPTMHEFKAGKLHSGSKKGPVVTNRKQAIAIGLNSEVGKRIARMSGGGQPSQKGTSKTTGSMA